MGKQPGCWIGYEKQPGCWDDDGAMKIGLDLIWGPRGRWNGVREEFTRFRYSTPAQCRVFILVFVCARSDARSAPGFQTKSGDQWELRDFSTRADKLVPLRKFRTLSDEWFCRLATSGFGCNRKRLNNALECADVAKATWSGSRIRKWIRVARYVAAGSWKRTCR